MKERTYTLKEVATILSKSFPENDFDTCARKVRHWTMMDLLVPQGKKYTGTGKSREYPVSEIRKAAILLEFSRWKTPMTVIAESFDIFLDDYEDGEEWKKAINTEENVYLFFAWNEDVGIIGLSTGEPKLNTLTLPHNPKELDDDDFIAIRPASGMIINLTRVFQRLKIE